MFNEYYRPSLHYAGVLKEPKESGEGKVTVQQEFVKGGILQPDSEFELPGKDY